MVYSRKSGIELAIPYGVVLGVFTVLRRRDHRRLTRGPSFVRRYLGLGGAWILTVGVLCGAAAGLVAEALPVPEAMAYSLLGSALVFASRVLRIIPVK